MNNELKENKPKKLDYEPTHNMKGDYAVLVETNDEENESWYYFIKVAGNEDNLHFLIKQIEDIEWCLIDDLSCFDIDPDHYVSATTAKEMTKLDINYHSFHRKFDGVLKRIDFKFKPTDSNERKIEKVNDLLGFGLIENFIDDEDLDEEDLLTDVSSDDDDDLGYSDDDDKMSRSSSSSDDDIFKKKINYKLPPSLLKK
jgi:hypothetical protein